MSSRIGSKALLPLAALMLQPGLTVYCRAQTPAAEMPNTGTPSAPLDADAELTAHVQQALSAHDYVTAEKLLLAEIERAPHEKRSARLLAWIGSIYFLDHDAMHAAIAWKKSEAIAPLDSKLQFSLAMAYISIKRPDWARQQLEKLAAADTKNALYPYWLGRLDYDSHLYPAAQRHFQQAIELDPKMARAYDNLGLAYYYQNQNTLAVDCYTKAIELDKGSAHPSPWPYLNLAITEQFLNQLEKAEAHLREAIRLDANLAQAHFQLGTVLEDAGKLEPATVELREAARLDPVYPEPHMALARLYHKLGQEPAAREEVQIYRRLHSHTTP